MEVKVQERIVEVPEIRTIEKVVEVPKIQIQEVVRHASGLKRGS